MVVTNSYAVVSKIPSQVLTERCMMTVMVTHYEVSGDPHRPNGASAMRSVAVLRVARGHGPL